jgi:REP element-mobilizing transposase RayT
MRGGFRFDPDVHHRRSVRLKGYDYASPGAYFVTICTHERLCTLGAVENGSIALSPAGVLVHEVWQSIPRRFSGTRLDAFVVMPNHVHGVVVIVGAQ